MSFASRLNQAIRLYSRLLALICRLPASAVDFVGGVADCKARVYFVTVVKCRLSGRLSRARVWTPSACGPAHRCHQPHAKREKRRLMSGSAAALLTFWNMFLY